MADVYYHIRYYLELGIRWMVNFPNKGIRIVSKTSMATNATGFGAKTQLRPVFLPAGGPGKLSGKCRMDG